MSKPRAEFGFVRRWVPLHQALVPLDDRGLLVGELLFESILVLDGFALRLAAHWRRLRAGLRALGFPLAPVRTILAQLVRELPRTDGRYALRVNVTRGPYQGLRPKASEVRVTATLRPVIRSAGISVGWCDAKRASPDSLPNGIKHAGYLPAVWALMKTSDDDVVVLNHRGQVAELTTSNLYLFIRDEIVTPALDQQALPGVARADILQIANALGCSVQETQVEKRHLVACTAAFASSATRGITPIQTLLGRRMPASDLTRQLQQALERREQLALARARQQASRRQR